jgi:predicted DNA-binding helix-hairpin-helix protein
MREHRLYQADWLMRFYGFERQEIVGEDGMLDLEVDPKLAWALAHRERFPVDVNKADREMLLRVPGLGTKSVDRLIGARRLKRVTLEDIRRIAGSVRKLKPFIVAEGWTPAGLIDAEDLRGQLPRDVAPRQLSLF